ncbi:DUF3089 domain-containing protein [Sphingobium phenoxybenzoativorans]|uniref:DUF3089 domain-containing protein n=1 Tax=Sphingobium phenoxybenzoativorans TaxID=1592790 RepID=UPI000872ECB8|nr:DUF3089 domain-containing protein [Sphingobium phenoxybenzoativorans]
MARKFLYVIAGLIVLALASSIAYRLWGQQLLTAAMVPSAPFIEPAPLTADDYARRDLWLARPDISRDNPGLWLPPGYKAETAEKKAAVFFVHPTSYLASFRPRWNMPLNDRESLTTAAQFLRGQASAFNAAGTIWAPKYRQAHFGAFLTDRPQANNALAAAYRDVAAAFEAFLKANPAGPVILAGHSQGSLHLMRLMQERIAGKPVQDRIAAVYLAGWPVSVEADLPALGLPACSKRGEAACILSWQSFAEPADMHAVTDTYDRSAGLTGAPRKDSRMLCINPLTGAPDSAAAESRNMGTLVLTDPPGGSKIVPQAVPARCDARGFLLIGNPPAMGPFALPGNNYHVYDYQLFWADIRRDAGERLATYLAR